MAELGGWGQDAPAGRTFANDRGGAVLAPCPPPASGNDEGLVRDGDELDRLLALYRSGLHDLDRAEGREAPRAEIEAAKSGLLAVAAECERTVGRIGATPASGDEGLAAKAGALSKAVAEMDWDQAGLAALRRSYAQDTARLGADRNRRSGANPRRGGFRLGAWGGGRVHVPGSSG